MPVDIGLWRLDGGEAQRLAPTSMPSERRLEDLIESDPSVLGSPLLIIGRQVPTSSGKFVDLLALDADGAVHVLELKRDRTPRDVVAQTLDYGSWVQELSHEDVLDIHAAYNDGKALEVAFEECFGAGPPEELNSGHYLTIVAADLDHESERIVNYLAGTFGVPVNAAFFRYFTDGDRQYLARTWLREQMQDPGPKSRAAARHNEPWNGKDWYVSFGEEPARHWEDARRLGFVSAGGGEWYSRSLRSLPEGARIWVCIPKTGYVGVGEVTGPATRFDDSHFREDPNMQATYRHDNGEDEWVVPVEWIETLPREKAVWEKGMYANQNTATKLRNSFTLQRLHAAFPNIEA